MRYLFYLGHQPHLSLAELRSVFSAWKMQYSIAVADEQYALLSVSQPFDPATLMNRLGGTIKIAEALPTTASWQKTAIHHLLSAQSTGKIQFSLTGNLTMKKAGLEIKKAVKETGRNIRYIEPKNTATILHNHLVEKQGDLTVFHNELFVTRAIQPITAFSERDFGRPESDDVSGMLPPKLARMLINIAEVPTTSVLLDPFCGSGTILMEALAMGYHRLLGSDISEKAVADTKTNIAWLQERIPENIGHPSSNIQIRTADARELQKKIAPQSVDAIVTEPYLGHPLTGRETKTELEKQTHELRLLYESAFRAFHTLLKSKGTVVFVIPTFRHRQTWITVPCIQEIQNIGFVPMPLGEKTASLLYHRPNQHVGRTIWKFRKK